MMVSVSSPATMAGLVAARKAHKPLFFLVCCAVAALGKVPGKGVVKILEFVALRCVLRTDVVPTLSFRLLYGLLIMGHDRRHILWLGVTAHPSAEWIANQLTAACGWEQVPHYLIRDRDACYGSIFIRRVRSLGIRDHPTSARSPWQNGYAERLIGSIRRECLDHIVVTGEQHLRHILQCYMGYYNAVRTHLSLGKDVPNARTIQRHGCIEVRPMLGGLHHQYVRI
jgi:transposase InsO family protein